MLLGVLDGQVLWQVVAVDHPDRAEDHGATQDAEDDVEPRRTEPKTELAPTTTAHDEEGNDPDTSDSADDPAPRLPERPVGSTSEELES